MVVQPLFHVLELAAAMEQRSDTAGLQQLVAQVGV